MNDLKPTDRNCLCWVIGGTAQGTEVTALSYIGEIKGKDEFEQTDLWEIDTKIKWYNMDGGEDDYFPYISQKYLMRIDGNDTLFKQEAKELECVE